MDSYSHCCTFLFHMDIISKNAEVFRLGFNTGQGVAHLPLGQTSVKVHKKAVLPLLSGDGTGLNPVHIQDVKNKMGKDII